MTSRLHILNISATSVRSFISRHERIFLPLALFFGFAVDALTLRRADLFPETILVYVYLSVAGLAIMMLHALETGRIRWRMVLQMQPFIPLALTYAFGGLFSAFVVFYTKSALISDSWPFLLFLVLVVVALELLREYRSKLVFNLAVFFLGLVSFSIYSVPLWVGRMGGDIFFISLVFATCIFAVFCALLSFIDRRRILRNSGKIVGIVLGVSSALTFFYAANILPPIPLVLRDIGVYHDVSRTESGYRLEEEPTSFLDRFFGQNVHVAEGNSLFVFSSVYTPVRLDAEIVHRWEYFDPAVRDWVVSTLISYPTEGGREEGYRGYSTKQSLTQGLWRVTVETPEGLKIGRTEFNVMYVDVPPQLHTEYR